MNNRNLQVFAMLALLAGMMTFGSGQALAQQRSVLVVDDDKVQCPNAQFTSINAAVAAAQPGDVIRVCPGRYNESVDVNKTLTFIGPQRERDLDNLGDRDHHDRDDRDDRKRDRDRDRDDRDRDRDRDKKAISCATFPVADPTREAIVDPPVPGTPGFLVQANNVVIDGFTVQDAKDNAGINLSRAFSGYQIFDNVIRQNTFGIYLNSDGKRLTDIGENIFLCNNVPGSAQGNGIYSDQGVSNANIARNFFTGQINASSIFVGNTNPLLGGGPSQAQFNLWIKNNAMIDDAPIIMVNTSNSQISDNVSIRSSGSGIFFGGNVRRVQVVGNQLLDGAFSGINLRDDPVDYPVLPTQPDADNFISDNGVSGFGDDGIRLREGATRNLVRNNRVDRNHRDGIRVETLANNNFIEQNRMKGNGEFDAYDDTVGTGTAGTANFWRDNECVTENRPGLCECEH